MLIALAAPLAAQDNRVHIDQIGSGNFSTIDQSAGVRQTATVTQDGTDNSITIEQRGSGRDKAEVTQDGDDNELTLLQDGNGTTELSLDQLGSGNIADVSQNNIGGIATLAQVVRFYSTLEGAVSLDHHRETVLRKLDLSDAEQSDLVAFLESLGGSPPAAPWGQPPATAAAPVR